MTTQLIQGDCLIEIPKLTQKFRFKKFRRKGHSRRPVFEVGKTYGVFTIIKEAGISIAPCGATQRTWLCKCNKCGLERTLKTQEIRKYRSCGCRMGKVWTKAPTSGHKSPPGTQLPINIVLSTYKSNARKRGLEFSLTYKRFEELVLSPCAFCGEHPSNKVPMRQGIIKILSITE